MLKAKRPVQARASVLNDLVEKAKALSIRDPRDQQPIKWATNAKLANGVFSFKSEIPADKEVLLIDLDPMGVEQHLLKTSRARVVITGKNPRIGDVDFTEILKRPATDLLTAEYLSKAALTNCNSLADVNQALEQARNQSVMAPEFADESIDFVGAPLLLNSHKAYQIDSALSEISRVLRSTGHLTTTVLMADGYVDPSADFDDVCGFRIEEVPTFDAITKLFYDSGFHGMTFEFLERGSVITVGSIEVYLIKIDAYVGTKGECLDMQQAAVYLGPWRSVEDDDGHTYSRGELTAVCAKTAEVLTRAPYSNNFHIMQPTNAPSLEDAPPFDCNTPTIRELHVLKGHGAYPPRFPKIKNPCDC